MNGDVIAAIIASIGGITVALVGVLGARKLGIGSSQEKLIATLNDLVEANEKKIKELEAQIAMYQQKILELETKIEELERATVDQALQISNQHDRLMELSDSIPKRKITSRTRSGDIGV